MLLQLRKRLTLLYTLITGLILTVVVISLAVLTGQSDTRQQETLFTNQLMTITNKLLYDSRISYNWLNSMEQDNQLLIHIEENNCALTYPGSFHTATERTILFERARQKVLKESVDSQTPPVSTSLAQSSLFTIPGDHQDLYRGTVMVFSTKNSFFSLILLQDVTLSHRRMIYRQLLFLLSDIIGIFCLLFANWTLTGKSLDPIRINEERQQAFIAAASHELRSPLAVINSSADAVCLPTADTTHFISNIKAECKRMSRLIQDLLLLASSKSNAWSLTREELDMDTLLLNLYERYEPLCKPKKFHFKLVLPDTSLPVIYGDGERIMHILSIFLDNALCYAPAGTDIQLEATAQKHTITCAVIDHGPGIPDTDKTHIFEYFYRSDNSRNSKEHFGLGLCVAAELTRLSHGKLELKDTNGGGCSFFLTLPRD